MPKIVKPLSDAAIRRAKPREREYNLADGSGLYLRIYPTGRKAWLFNYIRPYIGRRNNLQIGIYPEVTLDAAREKRQEFRKLLSQDIDPAEHVQQRKLQEAEAHQNTFEAVALRWFEDHQEAEGLTPAYAGDLINSLRNHVFPYLGKVPIHKVTATQAIAALQPLKKQGKFETIRRICGRMNMVMDDAINTGVIPRGSNPLSAIHKKFKKPSKVAKNYPTIKPTELPELLQKIDNSSLSPIIRNLFYWQLLNLSRPAEAAGARWDEIDGEESLWVIPAERMKRQREHKIPLTSYTIKILEGLKPISGRREYIFPGVHDSRRHVNNEAVNNALKRLGYQGKLVAHGLRALASTTLNEAKNKKGRLFDPEIIEVALAHVDSNTIRSIYNRAEYVSHRRRMLEWWGDHIEEALTGKKPRRAKKHLQLAK